MFLLPFSSSPQLRHIAIAGFLLWLLQLILRNNRVVSSFASNTQTRKAQLGRIGSSDMKYFEDGDLTVGIKPANRGTFCLDQIVGEWHIVWGHIDGVERHSDYDDPNILNVMGISIMKIEPQQDKRKKSSPTDDNIQIAFKFMKWGLIYLGYYDPENVATKLRLADNTTPTLVDPDDEAVLTLALVRDDQDHPIIAFSTSALELKELQTHDALQNMEFVAKMTDGLGIHPLELSRNERLRLGFNHDEDGNFEIKGSKNVNPTSKHSKNQKGGDWDRMKMLVNEVRRMDKETERMKQEIEGLQNILFGDLEEIGITQGPSSAANRGTPKSAGRSTAAKRAGPGKSKPVSATKATPKATPKTTPKAKTTATTPTRRKKRGGRRKRRVVPKAKPAAKTNGHITPEEEEEESESSEEDEDEEEDNVSDNDDGSAFSERQVNGTFSEDDIRNPEKMRRCELCDTTVTRKNWNVHVSTQKHQKRSSIGNSSSRKRAHASTSEPEDTDVRSSKRRNVASPNGKLKRPSKTALRHDGGAPVTAGRSA